MKNVAKNSMYKIILVSLGTKNEGILNTLSY